MRMAKVVAHVLTTLWRGDQRAAETYLRALVAQLDAEGQGEDAQLLRDALKSCRDSAAATARAARTRPGSDMGPPVRLSFRQFTETLHPWEDTQSPAHDLEESHASRSPG